MLWSLLKILVFVAIIALLALGAGFLMETSGGVQVTVAGTEYTLGPLQSVIALGVPTIFAAAMRDLSKLKFKSKSGGSRYIYELPWYIFIGPPGAGKTEALKNCGLEFGRTRSAKWHLAGPPAPARATRPRL